MISSLQSCIVSPRRIAQQSISEHIQVVHLGYLHLCTHMHMWCCMRARSTIDQRSTAQFQTLRVTLNRLATSSCVLCNHTIVYLVHAHSSSRSDCESSICGGSRALRLASFCRPQDKQVCWHCGSCGVLSVISGFLTIFL